MTECMQTGIALRCNKMGYVLNKLIMSASIKSRTIKTHYIYNIRKNNHRLMVKSTWHGSTGLKGKGKGKEASWRRGLEQAQENFGKAIE